MRCKFGWILKGWGFYIGEAGASGGRLRGVEVGVEEGTITTSRRTCESAVGLMVRAGRLFSQPAEQVMSDACNTGSQVTVRSAPALKGGGILEYVA